MVLENGAHRWVLEAMTTIKALLPFPLVGLDADNGGELIKGAPIKWVGDRDLFFTRSRPHKSNDNTPRRAEERRRGVSQRVLLPLRHRR